MCIEFFKTLFGFYRIKTERRLRKAAAEGGYKWELAKDITVRADIVVTAWQPLMIDGKGHCIVRTNGDRHSQIIRVGNHVDLFIKDVCMINTTGRCFRVDANAKLCVDACTIQSAGDGIVNHAKLWVCGGTTMTAAQTGAVCIRNIKTNETEVGEAVLYKCVLDTLCNEGVLTMMQNDSQIRNVLSKEGSEVYILNKQKRKGGSNL